MKPIYGQPTAISNVEFSRMLKKTKPPVGWSNKIGEHDDSYSSLIWPNSRTSSRRKLWWSRFNVSAVLD